MINKMFLLLPIPGVVASEVSQPEPNWYGFKFIIIFTSNSYLQVEIFKKKSVTMELLRTVRHVEGAMRGASADQISVLVRTVVESKTSKNVLRFLYAPGYQLDHELLRVAFSFHFQRVAKITVTVTSVNKMPKLYAIDDAVPVTPGIQLVEVTAPASPEKLQRSCCCSFGIL